MGRNKYILISVFEREIGTMQFKTFEEAHNQMMEELREEFFKNYDEDDEGYEELNDEKLTSYECDEFGFSKVSAWSNLDDDCNCDWLIVGID